MCLSLSISRVFTSINLKSQSFLYFFYVGSYAHLSHSHSWVGHALRARGTKSVTVTLGPSVMHVEHDGTQISQTGYSNRVHQASRQYPGTAMTIYTLRPKCRFPFSDVRASHPRKHETSMIVYAFGWLAVKWSSLENGRHRPKNKCSRRPSSQRHMSFAPLRPHPCEDCQI